MESSDSSIIMTGYINKSTPSQPSRPQSVASSSSTSAGSSVTNSLENSTCDATIIINDPTNNGNNNHQQTSTESPSPATTLINDDGSSCDGFVPILKSSTNNNDNKCNKQQHNGHLSNNKRDNHFSIEWSNLDYVIDSKWWSLSANRKPILNGLNGSFQSGQLSAILGPSGAGKSSLVDCLLGLKSSSSLSGSIKVNFENKQVEAERRRKQPLRIALIPQEDHLLDTLTVMETFMFASKIKNAQCSSFDHLANVQRVLRQLNLTSCSKTRCGKLSGGQYKRVSIGQELLSSPELMILDEPTSGLDSVTCYQTIKALRDLIETSAYPLAIVATIHQPDREVFSLFHKAYVLATGGRAIYEGPTENIIDTIQTGIELVNARRKQPFWQLTNKQTTTATTMLDNEQKTNDNGSRKNSILTNKLSELSYQLEHDQYVNSARIIVEVAANEYGFELISSLNEMQRIRSSHLQFSDNHLSDSNTIMDNHNGQGIINPAISVSSLYLDEIKSAIRQHDSNLAPSGEQNEKNVNNWPKNALINPLQSLNDKKFQSLSTSLTDNKQQQQQQQLAFDYDANQPIRRKAEQDNLLSLRKSNINQRRSLKVHLKHVYYHMHRSWITILRDPMLFMLMVMLHITFPLLISYTFYSTYKADACPSVGPFDVLEEAYRKDGSNILMDLNREIRATFENLGYMFFQIYVIIFAGVCVTSLTYPLVMHVLCKEFRNGWYSITSYFIGRTLADLPVPTVNVFIAMAISYHLTGQPHSPYCWRFLCVAGLTILATLVAQTQGLMFGALLMNLPQSAVFVAPASTAPLVIVSGFLIRVSNLPWILQMLSKLSFFSHLLNGFVVARYGFDKCGECDESLFAPNNIPRIPDQARVIIDLWAETYAADYGAANETDTRLVDKLVNNIATAKMFGRQITDCSQYKPFTMLDFELEDYHLYVSFAILALMLIFFRWATYIVLHWKIRSNI